MLGSLEGIDRLIEIMKSKVASILRHIVTGQITIKPANSMYIITECSQGAWLSSHFVLFMDLLLETLISRPQRLNSKA